MGRKAKGGAALHTRMPPNAIRDLKIEAAQRNLSLGDTIAHILVEAREAKASQGQLLDQLRNDLEAARLGERAALDVARRAVARQNALEGRLAQVAARTKAAMRREGTWQ